MRKNNYHNFLRENKMLITELPKQFEPEFNYLWENNETESAFFDLAKKIDNNIQFGFFNQGWQYRTVLHEDLEIAKKEFCMIILGCH